MLLSKLRFSEFTDEYKKVDLKSISLLIKDGTHGTHKNFNDGIPLLSAKDIYENKIHIPKDSRFISEEDFNSIYKNYSLKYGDILLTIVGTIGRTALYKNEKVAFQRSVASIRITNNNNSSYIKYYLECPNCINQLKNMTNSSAQGGIYLSSLEKIMANIPSLNEQNKVANFLSLLDKKIELQSKKIEALKMYKIYIKNILLSNIKSYSTFSLNEVLKSGNKTPVSDTNSFDKITIKLNYKGIEFSALNREMADTRPFYIRQKNEIIIGKQNYFNGSIALISEKFDNTICSNAIMSFTVKDNYNTKYVYYFLSQPDYIRKRAFFANGTGQKELSEKEFLKFEIKVPSFNEQNIIVNKIDKIEKLVLLEDNKLNELMELKKGLMQKMFV